jgi:hypothetical protein
MKTNTCRTIAAISAIAFLIVTISTTTSLAALIDYDSFSYNSTSLNGENGGTGWTGAWATTGTSPSNGLSNDNVSLSYPTSFDPSIIGPTPTGSRVVTGGLTANSASTRLLSQTIPLNVTGNVRYLSALFRKNAPNGDGVTNDNILLEFFDASNNRRWGMGIEGTTDRPWVNLNAVGTGGTAVTPGQTYFMVARIESFAAPTVDVAKLWVFGPGYASQVPATEPAAFDATATNNTAAILDRIRIRIDPGSTGAAPGEVDEIRIGNSWLDVVSVPEPSSLILLGVAAAAGLVRRRRA